MNLKITVAAIALVCAATAGVTASAEAATFGMAAHAADPGMARDAAAHTGSDNARVWQARHRGHGGGWKGGRHGGRWHHRRHRGHRWHGGGLGFALTLPFLALALQPHYNAAPPPTAYYPPAPRWRFDGRGWVCDYYDAYSRPLCR